MMTGSSSSYPAESGPDSVTSALDLLLEEIERESDCAKRAGADAFRDGDYRGVEASLARSKVLTEFYGKALTLRGEWKKLADREFVTQTGHPSLAVATSASYPKG